MKAEIEEGFALFRSRVVPGLLPMFTIELAHKSFGNGTLPAALASATMGAAKPTPSPAASPTPSSGPHRRRGRRPTPGPGDRLGHRDLQPGQTCQRRRPQLRNQRGAAAIQRARGPGAGSRVRRRPRRQGLHQSTGRRKKRNRRRQALHQSTGRRSERGRRRQAAHPATGGRPVQSPAAATSGTAPRPSRTRRARRRPSGPTVHDGAQPGRHAGARARSASARDGPSLGRVCDGGDRGGCACTRARCAAGRRADRTRDGSRPCSEAVQRLCRTSRHRRLHLRRRRPAHLRSSARHRRSAERHGRSPGGFRCCGAGVKASRGRKAAIALAVMASVVAALVYLLRVR